MGRDSQGWHRFKRSAARSAAVVAALKSISAFVRRFPWHRFAAGAIAGGGALIITLILRVLGLGLFLPEVAVDFTVGRIPGGIESFFIRTLGEGAKLLALLTAVIVFLFLPGIYATLFWRVQKWLKRRWFVIAFFTLTSAGIILLGILPLVDAGSWLLSVGGMVANPSTYRYADLLALSDPSAPDRADEFATLECVSNEVGGNLISTARWNGVRLSALLQAAGLSPNADWIVFTCADGYTAAVPLSRAMSPNTMVAVRMNDAPLVPAHGFPARIIVPGLYGMFHAKWLTKIEATRGEYLGYWQQKGWTNGGLIHTTAIIATPADSTVVSGVVHIGGIAFAGDRGISAVDVSTDGGASWKSATLSSPKSGLTWVLWTLDWTPPRSGSFRIVARAVDAAGTPQDSNSAPTFPEGSAGYDSITLLVS